VKQVSAISAENIISIIQSEIGNGTEIIVTVKKMKGENYTC